MPPNDRRRGPASTVALAALALALAYGVWVAVSYLVDAQGAGWR